MLSTLTQAQVNEWLIFNQNNSGLPSNSVKAIEFNADKTWIGTISGLGIKSSNSWEVYNTSNSSLENNYIRCISIDNNGVKWIGTTNGLVSINGSPSERGWTVYNSSNSGLPINNITSVAIDSNNKKWFGTWGGGIALLYNGIWEIFDMYNSPLPVNGVYDVKVDASNNVWIATHGGGLVKYDGVNWQIFNASNSNLPSNLVYSIDFDWQSNIWLGTELGLVKFNGTDHWTLYNSSNTGWNFAAVMCVKVDKPFQKVYFGTYEGMGIYANNAFTFMKTNNSSISNNWVSVINIDADNNKWIGTLGGGISVYNEDGVTISIEEINANKSQLSVCNYPNPVVNYVQFKINLPEISKVVLKIYDMTGKLQKVHNTEKLYAGVNNINFNLMDLPSGLYYYTIETSSGVKSSKLIKI